MNMLPVHRRRGSCSRWSRPGGCASLQMVDVFAGKAQTRENAGSPRLSLVTISYHRNHKVMGLPVRANILS